MIDREIIQSKFEYIKKYLKEIHPLLKKDAKSLLNESDQMRLYALERLFQLIVDTTLDINTHIIAESDFQIPDDQQSSFIIIAKNKVLPYEFAEKIAPSVGLRNRIVHKYDDEEMDVKRMVEYIKNNLSDYEEYMKYIKEFIEK